MKWYPRHSKHVYGKAALIVARISEARVYERSIPETDQCGNLAAYSMTNRFSSVTVTGDQPQGKNNLDLIYQSNRGQDNEIYTNGLAVTTYLAQAIYVYMHLL